MGFNDAPGSKTGSVPHDVREEARRWVLGKSVDQASEELKAVNQSLNAIASGSPRSPSTKEDLEGRKEVLEEYIQANRVRV